MATTVVMEALSPTMEEGRLVEWKKQIGDAVAVGDVLAEVETDKAVMDLMARAAGTLLSQSIAAGTTVAVGTPLAYIGAQGEAVPSAQAAQVGQAGQGGRVEQVGQVGEGGRGGQGGQEEQVGQGGRAGQGGPVATIAPPSGNGGTLPAASTARIKASPLARRIATERGVDLRAVAGSGPEGRIVMRDVATAQPTQGQAAKGATVSAPSVSPAPPAWTAEGYADVPLTQIRKTIARRLSQSLGPIPTFYLTAEADMERAAEARDALNAQGEGKVSFNDIIIKATALALKQHPACNAWWQDEHIRYWRDVHVSMAVAIDDGLITPVIRHADRKSLREIGTEARDLATRARDRKLKPDEYTGGTFSVSNLGMFDIDEFTAIINPPECGILAIGRIAPRAVAHEGQVVVRRRLRLTMSCDHRVIDGATGAAFLRTLVRMLENPLALVW